jgi:hypothetical protein
MGKITLEDIDTLAMDGTHYATSWKVTSDQDGQNILFKKDEDRVNLFSIITTLRNPDGSYYPAEGVSYAFVKFHYTGHTTDWIFLGMCGSNYLPQPLPYKLR